LFCYYITQKPIKALTNNESQRQNQSSRRDVRAERKTATEFPCFLYFPTAAGVAFPFPFVFVLVFMALMRSRRIFCSRQL